MAVVVIETENRTLFSPCTTKPNLGHTFQIVMTAFVSSSSFIAEVTAFNTFHNFLGDGDSKADIFFLKHDSSIFRQSFNPVCGFSMMEHVGSVFGPLRTGLALL